jgi:DNA-directed RNA polymerase specialized sigma24 family protein
MIIVKYKEISEVMGISIKTVEKHISKALLFLRTNIDVSPIILFFF